LVAFVDRLGSDRRNTRYYPYGEEYTATGNDKDKFATYFRDSSTGLDYAMNRYYGSSMGRFTAPDPSRRFNPADPLSLNLYSYTGGDPINATDRSGLYWELLGCEDAGYLDAESEMSGRQWRNCYYTSVEDEYATGPIQRPRPRGGSGGKSALELSRSRLLKKIDAECAEALGAKSVDEAVDKLKGITITYNDLGTLQFETRPDGSRATVRDSPPLAQYDPLARIIHEQSEGAQL
jgi:RHS repeat-associated protein